MIVEWNILLQSCIGNMPKYGYIKIEAGCKVKREIEYYNLDEILSVGYSINSNQDTLSI
jgi:hypothetical protein